MYATIYLLIHYIYKAWLKFMSVTKLIFCYKVDKQCFLLCNFNKKTQSIFKANTKTQISCGDIRQSFFFRGQFWFSPFYWSVTKIQVSDKVNTFARKLLETGYSVYMFWLHACIILINSSKNRSIENSKVLFNNNTN